MKKPLSEPKTYADAVKKWLAGYNQTVLGATAKGEYHYRKGDTRHYFHILTQDRREQNFLKASRKHVNFLKKKQLEVTLPDKPGRQEISLHRFFHHLNSSQALCLNLFLPLIHAGKVKWFLEHSNIPFQMGDVHACFEKESPWEKTQKGRPSRKSSFDFYVQGTEQTRLQRVFVEVKYSEREFGKAKNDAAHKEKFREVYQPLLEKAHPFIQREKIDCDKFLKNYQILRNLVHIRENSHVVFLVPKGNRKIVEAVKGVEDVKGAMDKYLSKDGQERCHLVFLEDLLDDLLRRTRKTDLEGHFTEFEHRYFPPGIRSFGGAR